MPLSDVIVISDALLARDQMLALASVAKYFSVRHVLKFSKDPKTP